ncbi:MAG: adenylate/guanylate cyclase domain-containing protein, partial [Proteobacteria bacterium]|nr:adenylate/guanylate cyclase domain-containing protein [Pseudomonadota bacterium]MBU1585870.1 adenylate/guanylate cyclase domain-containing protein [Pseudomonadota bacterium]MBU2452352.1 adenylate/guanylate cyclase domain-containing protein [Pseudomonadota bacterium]
MADKRFKRKLTVIFSTDVVGYSRLMGEDEEATVRTITSYRMIISALVQQHSGKVVDSPGDNLMAEFASVVDAVQCAVAIQKEIKARNNELPENRKMQFRIGINLGDVIQEEDRIYGDGVNIAARLEGLAEAGGICISKTAFDHIESKLPYGYEFLGDQTVKNITKPVSAYRVLMEPRITIAEKGKKRRYPQAQPRKVSLIGAIAVIALTIVAAIWIFYIHPLSPPPQPASVEKSTVSLPEQSKVIDIPLTGEEIAQAEFPLVGTKYTYKIVTEKDSYKRSFVVMEDGIFEGREVHHVSILDRNEMIIYDKESKNWIGKIFNGELVKSAEPHDDLYKFPLFVGKKYQSEYFLKSKVISGNISRTVVMKSFENVIVPAGSFKAFKIIANRKGVKDIYWYSPELRLYIKRITIHHRDGKSTSELIQYSKPGRKF